MSSSKFQEKKFLLFLLSNYQKEYGENIQFVEDHKFGVISLEVKDKFPFLYDQDRRQNKQDMLTLWFKEACARNHLKPSTPSANLMFKFTESGYSRALELKNPIKSFVFNHWKWSLAILITIINTSATIVRLMLSQ